VRLSALVSQLATRGFESEHLGADADVSNVTSDSRAVVPGDLFVALPGARTDGSRFIAQARSRGAAAVACAAGGPIGVPTLVVRDIARAAGYIAAAVYDHPAQRVQLVGVTGTNGKTSCTYVLESIWRAAGERAGVIGTVSVRWPGREEKAAMTTPAAADLQRTIRAMADAGCRCVAMEVSSHALDQHRAAGCSFSAAVFTNLTRDHLDYHGDEESYFAAKAKLFDHLSDGGVAVLNADDAFSMRIASRLPAARVRTFSLRPDANAWAKPLAVDCGLAGLRGTIRVGTDTIEVRTRLVGAPNLANVLAAAATARALGVVPAAIAAGIAACAAVPGRLERVGTGFPVVLVDYAHTPDALERTLATVRDMTPARLIVVFGCGGDRDKGKRPLMGGAAARIADVAVLTSDNPRSEDPLAILADIERGIEAGCPRLAPERLRAARGYAVQPDRETAISLALGIAREADVVVVAGKGHEDYQEIAGVRRPFDDRQVVARLQAGVRASA
jgi:UDP-N-acetylmuramoyl-L-alanyl-D-glutamate--2,6-diaminopimelate ligase